jgi:hypothetical protein
MTGLTTNNLKFSIRKNTCTIEIPVTKGIYWIEFNKAQKELIYKSADGLIPFIKEFKVKKTGNFQP